MVTEAAYSTMAKNWLWGSLIELLLKRYLSLYSILVGGCSANMWSCMCLCNLFPALGRLPTLPTRDHTEMSFIWSLMVIQRGIFICFTT